MPLPVTGVLLAAGAGRRMGVPKALVRDPGGTPWVELGTRALLDGGCREVVVVLGAAARTAQEFVPDQAEVRSVVAPHWAAGPGGSLAAGLRALDGDTVACVSLVDLPTLPVAVVRRILGSADDPDVLRRAVFGERPGHPVLVGPAHRSALVEAVESDPTDRVAGAWLRRAGVVGVDCADLWDGADRDRASDEAPR
ncbi:molybdopterin-guanine dinucleotide biosynthesis protein MobA [Curtobacterium sp. SGAir0471]|uniref:nucleotidyltransferase family protein n=1 Tax=Curtobacterium sp. SGAir0471 TaxID=2070337 RepID=UPI0010CCB19A|nr:NTP transferase domain-containing protein [Curtobacterium sp. SGAir0471]QCR45209.1 molybdopterin-guanine dinucleotide biosynthesis protein MobA [Curtobacterium sp. SGAir0471]